ncbi:MAG TPA: S9 family peptidase [Pyrinomonadaceae bacterium]|nr:S9 family peptidase [Pyrinomonadaceae bacterium]
MKLRTFFLSVCFLSFALAVVDGQSGRRPLKLNDLFRIKNVSNPQLSPDGQWVAYVVSTIDVKGDKSDSNIWMVSFDGKTHRQITFSTDSETSPQWSPDGKYLSFLSSRPGPNRGGQVWILDVDGGEARQLTDIKGRLQSYEWSPDSKRMAMVIGDPDPDDPGPAVPGATPKPPKPIVLDRYKIKQDGQGYLTSTRKSYVYLYDIAAKTLDRLTKGKVDEGSPVWSPDGTRIAFTSNRKADPDRDPGSQIYVAEAKAGSIEKQVTPGSSRGGGPEWSPDGKSLVFLESDELKYGAYNMNHLTVVASDGSSAPVRVKAAEDLDRGVSNAEFSLDGKWLYFLVTDDMSVYPARIGVADGKFERLMPSPVVISSVNSKGGRVVALSGGNNKANEVYAFENGSLRQLSRQNDDLFAEFELPLTEEVRFKSADGTDVSALLTYPYGYVKGTKVPFLLRIHGGPNGQDQNSFSAERQFFAANGYAVMAVNYRGSAGRGQKFSRSIFANWGVYEVQDLHAGVDHAIKMGVADPDKLGVGGWSYGGILTDYLIASDNRFKAATSGAGTAFTVSYYGSDQYITQYDNEIGPPWEPKAWETYQKLSYPFLQANRIKTPTLFLGGDRDFNVPISGGEQMYQALRSLGVDTQLIIYPNENHGISRPSYVRDRYERYLAWYDKYVKKKAAERTSPIAAWEGKWIGKLTNVPATAGAAPIDVTMEIGNFPTADNTCGKWKTTYTELGTVNSVKDYKICRGTGVEDLYIDEGGARLTARVIGDSLIVPFKSGNVLLVSTMRTRGETLEQEILTVDDKPATSGVQPMHAKGIQKIELRRVTESK